MVKLIFWPSPIWLKFCLLGYLGGTRQWFFSFIFSRYLREIRTFEDIINIFNIGRPQPSPWSSGNRSRWPSGRLWVRILVDAYFFSRKVEELNQFFQLSGWRIGNFFQFFKTFQNFQSRNHKCLDEIFFWMPKIDLGIFYEEPTRARYLSAVESWWKRVGVTLWPRAERCGNVRNSKTGNPLLGYPKEGPVFVLPHFFIIFNEKNFFSFFLICELIIIGFKIAWRDLSNARLPYVAGLETSMVGPKWDQYI